MIKSITLLRDDVDDVAALFPDSGQPARLAVCRVRKPTEITAVVLSWHTDESTVPEALGGFPTAITEERTVNGEDWLDECWDGRRSRWSPVLIGLIRRAPHLSRPEFADYWWSEHRDFEPVAYVHNYVRADQASEWDGIGELYEGSIDNARSRGRWFASEAGVPMLEDEDRFMVRAARQVVVTDLEVLRY
jgi:hypothetical protein